MVPRAEFRSYYGLPVLNAPVWKAADIAGYLFLGGLAGGVVAAGRGRARSPAGPGCARAAQVGAAGAVSGVAGGARARPRPPERFLNMLRVFKPTSPMSVGSWLLARLRAARRRRRGDRRHRPRPAASGPAATGGAALLGPAVAAYTAVLIADTAVPAWHDGHRELPYVFVGSAATAAGGLGLLAAPARRAPPGAQAGPAGRRGRDRRVRVHDAPPGHSRRALPLGHRRAGW